MSRAGGSWATVMSLFSINVTWSTLPYGLTGVDYPSCGRQKSFSCRPRRLSTPRRRSRCPSGLQITYAIR